MKISVLAENTAVSDSFINEHGLSLQVVNAGTKYLLDMGASDAFLKNAASLKLDIAEVEVAIVSHGHQDHGGGLSAFLKANSKAPVYLSRLAFGDYFSKRDSGLEFIGLDRRLLPNSRFIFCEGKRVINKDATLFSGVELRYPLPRCNSNLYMHEDGIFVHDKFRHEQNLLLRAEDGRLVLFTGCAHNGILNIMYKVKIITGSYPDVVVGGMHLTANGGKALEETETVVALGKELAATKAQFYTCHCTGDIAYATLKQILGDRIDYLSTGAELTI